MQESISLSINNWSEFQPRKDLKSLNWVRIQSDIFQTENFYYLSNNEKLLFFYLLTYAGKKNCGEFLLNAEFTCSVIKLQNKEFMDGIKNLERLQIVTVVVTNSSRTRENSSSTNITNDTNITLHNKQPDFDFEFLYAQYPLKKGKSSGFKRLKKEIKNTEDFNNFEKSVLNYKKDLAMNKTKLQFTKHFSTFVSEWRDWINFETQRTGAGAVFDNAKDQIRQILAGEL